MISPTVGVVWRGGRRRAPSRWCRRLEVEAQRGVGLQSDAASCSLVSIQKKLVRANGEDDTDADVMMTSAIPASPFKLFLQPFCVILGQNNFSIQVLKIIFDI